MCVLGARLPLTSSSLLWNSNIRIPIGKANLQGCGQVGQGKLCREFSVMIRNPTAWGSQDRGVPRRGQWVPRQQRPLPLRNTALGAELYGNVQIKTRESPENALFSWPLFLYSHLKSYMETFSRPKDKSVLKLGVNVFTPTTWRPIWTFWHFYYQCQSKMWKFATIG